MIGINSLTNNINTVISQTAITDLQSIQLAGAIDSLTNRSLFSVENYNNLPDAALNLGRLVFVNDIKQYAYSNGAYWILDETNFRNIFTVGGNTFGQLGVGDTVARTSFSPIPTATTMVSQIVAGGGHCLVLDTLGIIYSWGYGVYGQLGDGSTLNRLLPVQVASGGVLFKQITAGANHSGGISASGGLYMWGRNNGRQLGDNTNVTGRSNPVRIGSLSTWTQVSAGDLHSMALTVNGELYGYGSNTNGRLGDGTVTTRGVPTRVGTFTDWTSVSAGWDHTVALRSNGTAWAWGRNHVGQLGDGTTINRSAPVQVLSNISSWENISAGFDHTIGILATSTNSITTANSYSVYFSGADQYLQLPYTDQLSFGLSDFTIEAWVYPFSPGAKLTNYTIIDSRSPSATNSAWKVDMFISGGNLQLQFTDGSLTAFGGTISYNTWTHVAVTRHLGEIFMYVNGTSVYGPVPYNVSLDRYSFTRIGMNTNNVNDDFLGYISNLRVIKGKGIDVTPYNVPTAAYTATTDTSILLCQDLNLIDRSKNNLPIEATNLIVTSSFNPFGSTSTSLPVSYNKIIYAWGSNEVGQLGNSEGGLLGYRSSPVPISSLNSNWIDIDAGNLYNLALTSNGIAYAWGDVSKFPGLIESSRKIFPSPVSIVKNSDWIKLSGRSDHIIGV